MKKALLFTVISFVASSLVYAQEATSERDNSPVVEPLTAPSSKVSKLERKADELELEKDVESMEQFGEAASEQEAKVESRQLEKETRQLERDIQRLHSQNLKAKEKAKRYAELYKKKAKLAAEYHQKANLAEREKNTSERQMKKIDDRVKLKEQLVIKYVEARKGSEQRVAQLKREIRDLSTRLARAEAKIKSNLMIAKRHKANAKKLAQNKAKLQHKVIVSERTAQRTSVVR